MGFRYIIIFGIISLVESALVNDNVERNLDLSSQLVKENLRIKAKDTDNRAIYDYDFIISNSDRKHLAFLSAECESHKDIKISERLIDGQARFTISFPSASIIQVFNLILVFDNLILPYPEEIRQNEKQLVKYTGQLYFVSPYLTMAQTTNVKINGNSVSYTQFKPFSEKSNKIKYGPFENVEAFSNRTFSVHYENNSPFITVTNLERILEVSHWGNIAVKESIDLSHTGARLKGPFSRYEFQKDGRSGLSAVKSYKTVLPASATEVYYRDTNGNISTSNMKILRDFVELELRPRFPLFGGWKSYYILGYNVPSYEYLFTKDDIYVLQMNIIDHIFDDMLIENAILKIVLPEGASDIELFTPFPVKRLPDELRFTYLDTIGRPVIAFSKKNLVENHITNFQLKYTFKKVSLMHEPLLAFIFVFFIFLVCIICLRLDCNISTHNHKE